MLSLLEKVNTCRVVQVKIMDAVVPAVFAALLTPTADILTV